MSLTVYGYDTGVINFVDSVNGIDSPGVVGTEVIYFWNEVEPQEGCYDFSAIDKAVDEWSKRNKKVDIRVSTVHNQPFNTPRWFYEKYNVRLIARGYWCDFENDSDRYLYSSDSKITHDPKLVLSGEKSLIIPSGGSLLLDPAINLAGLAEYCVQFDYKALHPGICRVSAKTFQGGDKAVRTVVFDTNAKPSGSKVAFLQLKDFSDYKISVGSDNGIIVDNVNITKIVTRPEWTIEDFEDNIRFVDLTNAVITNDPEKSLDGSNCVYAKNTTDELLPVIRNDPSKWNLEKGKAYALRVNVKAIEDSNIIVRFYRTGINNIDAEIYKKSLSVKAGDTLKVPLYGASLFDHNDYMFELTLEGEGEICIDDLVFMAWSDRVVGFPNYFDDNFKLKWQKLVKEIARRYNSNPDVGVISVGGFGRWEEVMLDEDNKGVLDRQWLAFGFTQQKYLKHIIWTMDLYGDCFPDKDLRICLAYGLHNVNDVDWIYRRVAQQAVSRGIGLKQNGLSERYDSWNDNTNTSYLFENYRDNPDIRLTFETGGQIYRDQNLVMGHPLSIINRALVSGVDNLFLYDSDIYTKNVAKYLNYASSQMGGQLFTLFYNRFGDYSMINDHSPIPVEYHNLWLGLRQLPSEGSNYTDVNGVKCAVAGKDDIVIDIDDRYQYSGMYSSVLGVKYYDKGQGSFKITFAGGKPQTITKSDSGKWKWSYIYNDLPTESKRNRFKDIHNDIVINSNSDGIDYVEAVELAFVPARGWQKNVVTELPLHENYKIPTPTLACQVEIPQGSKADFVSIPLWTDINDTAFALLKVYSEDDTDAKVVKEVYLPADKQWVDIPILNFQGTSLVVEMIDPEGSIGWYESSDGNLAYRILSYKTLPVQSGILKKTNDSRSNMFYFNSNKPFCGINLIGIDTVNASNIKINRILPDDTFYSVGTGMTVYSQDIGVFFSPLTAGNYCIEIPSDEFAAAIETLKLEIHQMQRKEPASKPLEHRLLDTLFTQQLNITHYLNDNSISGVDKKGFQIFNDDGKINIIVSGVNVLAGEDNVVTFTMKNETACGLARLSWNYSGTAFNKQNSVYIPIVSNDENYRQYEYHIGLEPMWKGKITAVKLEPAIGMIDTGVFSIKEISIKNIP
ncbi:MAG: beta-galactosidase [Sedimentisphaeraceae bacterium JB056]